MLNAAARALAAGDLIGALNRVSLREDAPALAIRGIIMAQLGRYERARELLKAAEFKFDRGDDVLRARCVVADAEVALVSRDLSWPEAKLFAAQAALESGGDKVNAAHAQLLIARRMQLSGRITDADALTKNTELSGLPPALRAMYKLFAARIAMLRTEARNAIDLIQEASVDAEIACVPAVIAEVEALQSELAHEVGIIIYKQVAKPATLADVELLFASNKFVVDACRFTVRNSKGVISLAGRPVLFRLLLNLAAAWPGDVYREDLIVKTFRGWVVDETQRVRLRVEIGRLRSLLKECAEIEATPRGFTICPHGDAHIVTLQAPLQEPSAALLAILADGESWTTSGLSEVLGLSQRSIQRQLSKLVFTNQVHPIGSGRKKRWRASHASDYPTTLLLPGALPFY